MFRGVANFWTWTNDSGVVATKPKGMMMVHTGYIMRNRRYGTYRMIEDLGNAWQLLVVGLSKVVKELLPRRIAVN